jgi:hypothetical protein
VAPSSPESRPSPSGGLRPALTPAPGDTMTPLPGCCASRKIRSPRFQGIAICVSVVGSGIGGGVPGVADAGTSRGRVEGFIARCLLAGRERIDFSGLSPQLRLDERLGHCQGVDHDHWRPARTSATISSEVDPHDRSQALSLATISASVGPAAILDSSPATKATKKESDLPSAGCDSVGWPHRVGGSWPQFSTRRAVVTELFGPIR